MTSVCHECDTPIPAPTRYHDNGCEFRCPRCGTRHTRKPGDPDYYAFFPGDIYRALSDDLEPLVFWSPDLTVAVVGLTVAVWFLLWVTFYP